MSYNNAFWGAYYSYGACDGAYDDKADSHIVKHRDNIENLCNTRKQAESLGKYIFTLSKLRLL